MNEVIYNGEVVELDTTIAEALIEEYQDAIFDAECSNIDKAVEILSKKVKDHDLSYRHDQTIIASEAGLVLDLEMLYIDLEILQERIKYAEKLAFKKRIENEIRWLKQF